MSDNWWQILKEVPPPENKLEVRQNWIPCPSCKGAGCRECSGKGKKQHPKYPYGPLPREEGL